MSAVFDASAFLATCSNRPGVYRMFDADAKLLYVGKAKSLKKRLASYFRKSGLAPKTAALVARIAQVETTITANETEALLLEQTLIKEWRPPYNILLRDDKSYPFVFLSSEDEYPRLSLHRGAKKRKGRYFGPLSERGSDPREPQPAAEGVSRPPVRGQLFPQPYAALPAIPDQALQGALRGAGQS
ncbi:GIY-YIG nuclease family protein [Pseudomonas aeruginosa]|nr:GIY-YIG nuclease family protein [Pseudomonas aeruginosa]